MGRDAVPVCLALATGWLLVVAAMSARTPSWRDAVLSADLVAYVAVLAAGAAAWAVATRSRRPVPVWASVAVAAIGAEGLLMSLDGWHHAPQPPPSDWAQLADAALALLLLVVVALSWRTAWERWSGTAALATVAGWSIAQIAVADRVPSLPGAISAAAGELILAAGVLVTVRVTTRGPWAAPLRWLTAAAAVALLGRRLVDESGLATAGTRDVVAAGLTMAGAALTGLAAIALVRHCLAGARPDVAELPATHADVRSLREQLHEARATVAGVLFAAEVLDQDPELTPGTRRQLTQLIAAEIGRLHRLLEARTGEEAAFALDDAIRPLVLARRASGLVVHWTPTGHWVFARRDDVVQALGILLDNAAVHAPGATVWIEVAADEGWLDLVVADDGPGVPPDLRPTLFDWGTRGPDSPGSGIGLHVARRLIQDSGGYLRLETASRGGAAFVVGIPEITTLEVRGGDDASTGNHGSRSSTTTSSSRSHSPWRSA